LRSILIPLALVLLTGAAAPVGCVFNTDKSADTGEEPAEIGIFGNACQPGEETVVEMPEDAAYILSVQAVRSSETGNELSPMDAWVEVNGTLAVDCPSGVFNFIATYATTEIL